MVLFYTTQLVPERSEGAKHRVKLNHLSQEYRIKFYSAQTAKIRNDDILSSIIHYFTAKQWNYLSHG
ncbi:hypothetical protein TSAR_006249 [Trichomalopsis sarcophagae]|uniref:Uncharacterized protein n=1 Tax=Trichomalopsis sarcophagae TaxID=543379 RepID=A0A232EL54_9HYME|nr:hypothetical protein TSAR_006249 [Trichomalopsis sarcophagae]